MRIHILGSGAGGGLPQWNCACVNCRLVRAGDPGIAARTQDSIALAGSGTRGKASDASARDAAGGDPWLVVNASPDVLRQIERFEPLWPRAARHTPIGALALTNGDLDHVVGLLSLRESQPLRILATRRVRDGLVDRNAVLRTLARTADQVTWVELALGQEIRLDDVGLGVTAVPVPGKLPVHLVGLAEPSPEDNVALRVRDLASGRVAVLATALGALDAAGPLLEGADALLLDGTFWSEDELVAQGLGKAHARDMAHVPVGGAQGSLARLGASAARRVYTHINNTNPMLRAGSPERAEVERAGWAIAFDGMNSPYEAARHMNPSVTTGAIEAPPSPEAFVERLRSEGAARYHDRHPFNVRMHAGGLRPDELRRWVVNRYYYQTRIPIKDAIIVSKSEDPAFRRAWIRRVGDHDGANGGEGGLHEWLVLARGIGLDEGEVRSCARVLPAVRHVCDAYVELVRTRPLVEAVASSLTEHFAPQIMRARVAAWQEHYPWVGQEALGYFRSRVPRATRDAEEALAFVVAHATTRASQEACVRALLDKCRILWGMLDAVAEATA